MFDGVFIQVLNMSRTAGIIIAAVILIRLTLKKAPKLFSYALWVVVLFRLLCPFAFESEWGLIPGQEAVRNYSLIDENVSFRGAAAAAWEAVGDAANGGLGILTVPLENTPDGENRHTFALHWEVWILFGKYVWAAGIAVLLFYSGISYVKLRRRLIGAVKLRDNIWLADGVESPFVMGVIKPKIYLPSALAERERDYIILHEQTHIRRGDHIVKILSFAALCVHWINPLVWAAFILSGRDMELSCDESVMRRFGEDIRREYSESLLHLATGRRVFAATPLAFGEGETGGRIRNVLRFKRPSWIIVAAATVLVAALSVAFAVDGVSEPASTPEPRPTPVSTPQPTAAPVEEDDTVEADTTTLDRTETISVEGNGEEIRTRLFVSTDGYSFYYDYERYAIASDENKTLVYPVNDPDMKIAYAAIEHLADIPPEDARAVQTEESVISVISDNTGGCYILSVWYTPEAAEGHGARLGYMLDSFAVTSTHTYFEGYDRLEVEAFAGDVKRLIEAGDKQRLSNMIHYPISVTIDGQRVTIDSEWQFVREYEKIANEDFVKAVSEASARNMFSNYMGVMIGNGEIWFGHVSGKDGLWIYAINNGSGTAT